MNEQTIIKDIKTLNAQKKKVKTTNEYIELLIDITNLFDVYEYVYNKSINKYELSPDEINFIKKNNNCNYKNYLSKMIYIDKKITKLFINNIKSFKSLNFKYNDIDYLANYEKNDLIDIAIDFYNNIDKDFGKIIYNFVNQDNLLFFQKENLPFEGFSISSNFLKKNYALVAKNKNNSVMLDTIIHELAHIIDFSYNRYEVKFYYHNFIEVLSYTLELLFLDYLQNLKLIPQENIIEKDLLQTLYLDLVKLKLLIKDNNTIESIATTAKNMNLPFKYYSVLLNYLYEPVEALHQYPYAKSIAYLFLEQYKFDKELMIYNLKDFTKNHFYRSDYENLNDYGLSLDQIKNNKPLKKALQKYL